MVMQEGVFDIQLMNWSRTGECKFKNCADDGRFDNRIKSLNIVQVRLLIKFTDYLTCFIVFKRIIEQNLCR